MKLTFLLLQVALVGAGILIYDQVRDEGTPAAVPEAVGETARPEPERREPEWVPPAVLEGGALEIINDRLTRLEERQSAVERAMTKRTTVVADNGPSGESSYPSTGGSPLGPPPVDTREGADERIRESDLQWFRAVKSQVEEIERRERYVQMIGRQLDRLGVSLTDTQRSEVIDTTVAFRERVRQTIQRNAARQGGREEREQALAALRSEFEKTVYNLVPSAEGDKIVEALGRYPGFGWRRDGRGLGGR